MYLPLPALLAGTGYTCTRFAQKSWLLSQQDDVLNISSFDSVNSDSKCLNFFAPARPPLGRGAYGLEAPPLAEPFVAINMKNGQAGPRYLPFVMFNQAFHSTNFHIHNS